VVPKRGGRRLLHRGREPGADEALCAAGTHGFRRAQTVTRVVRGWYSNWFFYQRCRCVRRHMLQGFEMGRVLEILRCHFVACSVNCVGNAVCLRFSYMCKTRNMGDHRIYLEIDVCAIIRRNGAESGPYILRAVNLKCSKDSSYKNAISLQGGWGLLSWVSIVWITDP
jgi:hypothetical protein